MDHLFERLGPLIRKIIARPFLVLGLVLLLSLLSGYLASQLRIDTEISRLLPDDYPSVQALNKLSETVGGETAASLIIESPDFAATKKFAEDFIQRAQTLEDGEKTLLSRVDYRRDTRFMQHNALYFASEDELDELEDFLNDKIEESRLDANPFFFDLDDEDEEESESDGGGVTGFEEAYSRIVPKEYPISDDSTTMVVELFPTGSKADLGFVDRFYASMNQLSNELDPKSYHPEMVVNFGGRFSRQATEVRAITRDVQGSFIGGVATVLFIVMLYFFYKSFRASRRKSWLSFLKMPMAAVLIALPLIMSLTWTFALAFLAFEKLNLMTSTLVLVLFGLGVDYGIHFFARYAEEREEGLGLNQAVEKTFMTTGPPIAVSAFTTAASMLVLVLADFKGFSEFGFIAGTGILFALLAMLFVLPALIVAFDRLGIFRAGDRHTQEAASIISARPDRSSDEQLSSSMRSYPYKFITVASLAIGILALVFVNKVPFEYRFSELEPTFEDYSKLRAKEGRVNAGGKRNPAYFIVDDISEVQGIKDALIQHSWADTLTPTILSVESLQERFPMTSDTQEERLDRIAIIKELLDDPFLAASDSEDLAKIRLASQTIEPISQDSVPDYIKARFTSKSGEIGQFVMVYPSVGLSDGRRSIEFSDDVGTITTEEGKVYHAGSTSLVAADMLRLLLQESPWMIGLTTVILIGLMYLIFRSIGWTLLATAPLILGVLWMLGLLELGLEKLNFYNLIVLPAVLGIGNDAGIHIVHRYREEGPGSLGKVLRSTGEHVFVGAATTLVGFAWWLFSHHPGLNSIGSLAVIGIACVMVTSLVFLPALLAWRESRANKTRSSEA